MTLWDQAETVLKSELHVRRVGGLMIAANEAEVTMLSEKASIERAAGLPVEMISREDLKEMAPCITERAAGALYCPAEGMADPLKAATAFAAGAEQAGASIRRGVEVLDVERVSSGFCVVTATERFSAPRVINAAGMNAGRIAGMVGATLETASYPIQVGVTERLEPTIGHLVYSSGEPLTVKQTHEGTVIIGGGWPAAVSASGRPQVSGSSLAGNVSVAVRTVPALRDARVVRAWAAWVNGNDSWLPVIGELPGVAGFFINYVPWMGFSGSPAAGRIVSSLVQGKPPPVEFDLSAFRPSG
jgi:glycine/D-amino acid oxidase-like deaminating enzyme